VWAARPHLCGRLAHIELDLIELDHGLMLDGARALELLTHTGSQSSSMFVVGKPGGSQLGERLSHSELQVGWGASPSVSEGLRGLLIEVIVAEAAHTERGQRGIVVRWQGAVVSVRWQDMQGRSKDQ
jgi:hypothetical protein